MERSVEVLAVILFSVIGLSHIVQPKAWVDYFVPLRSKGEAACSQRQMHEPARVGALLARDGLSTLAFHAKQPLPAGAHERRASLPVTRLRLLQNGVELLTKAQRIEPGVSRERLVRIEAPVDDV